MITFEHVTKRYGERLALDDVSWSMDAGECVVFLGPSGSGKTTVFRLVTHETHPTSGTIEVGTFHGSRKLSRGRRALLRRTLGIVFEDFRLLSDRTVFENVALAVRITGRSADAEVVPRVLFALEEVGLQHKRTAYPAELSAGEKQRAAVARAIVNRPTVLLADEPTGALEPRSAGELVALLRRIHEEGTALVLATTREDVAAAIGGRTLRLDEGRLVGDSAAGPHAGYAPPAAPAPEGAPAAEAAPEAAPGSPPAPAPEAAPPGAGA